MHPDVNTTIDQPISQASSGTHNFMRRPMDRAALNDEQRTLVNDNIGLVYVHMRHYVAPHEIPWTQREREDLVQEGCLGLIRAAQDFNPQGKIPFAAFALPRIHTAIRRVMLTRFGDGVAFAGGASPSKGSLFGMERKPDWSPRKARRTTFDDDPLDTMGDWWGLNTDTVGMRMREKYERAVHRAVAQVLEQNESTKANHELIEALAKERHLVPDAHARKPFRQIAKRINAPYTRVIEQDRQLREAIRRGLERDPEFAELRRKALAEPRGVDAPVDARLDASLARLCAAEILQRVLHSSAEQRGRLTGRLLGMASPSLLESIRREVELLPVAAREELLMESSPVWQEELGVGGSVENENTRKGRTAVSEMGKRRT